MDRHVFQFFFFVALLCWFINLPSVLRKLENSVLSGSDEQLGCLCLAASLLYGASLTFLLSSTCLCEQSTNQECQSVSVVSELRRHLWMIDKSTKIYTLFWSLFCRVTIIRFDLDWDLDLFVFFSNNLCSWITFCYCSELLLSVLGEFSPQKSLDKRRKSAPTFTLAGLLRTGTSPDRMEEWFSSLGRLI